LIVYEFECFKVETAMNLLCPFVELLKAAKVRVVLEDGKRI